MLIFLKILSATVLYCNIKNQVCLRATSLDNEILKGTMSIKCLPSIYFAKVTRLETSIFVFSYTVCLGLRVDVCMESLNCLLCGSLRIWIRRTWIKKMFHVSGPRPVPDPHQYFSSASNRSGTATLHRRCVIDTAVSQLYPHKTNFLQLDSFSFT